MRVLLVNTTDLGGGAAIAATRLMGGLKANGVKAHMLVGRKRSESISVSAVPSAWRHQAHFLRERLGIWMANGLSRRHLWAVDSGSAGTDITGLPEFYEADVIHLHWINQGFLSLANLRKILASGKPVVWTMHDMWPFTGICHYAGHCEAFREGCHHCPLLRFPRKHDLSYRTFQKKLALAEKYSAHFVAVSQWLARIAQQSPLMARQTIEVIPNALPIGRFSLKNCEESRCHFGLPQGKVVLVFGAVRIDEPRKGFHYLKEALRWLIDEKILRAEEMHLALFGGIKDKSVLEDLPVEYTCVGFLENDDALASLYAAAQAAVIPSEYETFGQTVIEAQACGCVPVTFGGSGQEDIILHKVNGWLAHQGSVEDLAKGIIWALKEQPAPELLRQNVMQHYSEEAVARKYIALYESILRTKT